MDINETMKNLGFVAWFSGGGCQLYTKKVPHTGKAAYIAITDDSGFTLPIFGSACIGRNIRPGLR